MTDHLLMVLEDEAAHAAEAPDAVAKLIAEQARFAEGLRRDGVLKDRGRFRPSTEAKRVSRVGGRVQVQDGPFVEAGRALAGYYVVEADDADGAARIAQGCPTLATDEIDVRPVMKGRIDADKGERPGRSFACAVRGNAPTEDDWVAVMDRIDAETGAPFRGAEFLGGVRLRPPKAGRRVATDAARRAMFDGPFLESKEIIGGLFFVRLTRIDEAVALARESPFVVHGALEIRELWRS